MITCFTTPPDILRSLHFNMDLIRPEDLINIKEVVISKDWASFLTVTVIDQNNYYRRFVQDYSGWYKDY